MSSLVSVIIPVYNEGILVQDCINSVIANNYQNIEIIIVDDGSEKETAEICDEIAKSDNRIIVLHQENAGVSSARNRGIDCSNGEYITFVDADDKLEITHISTLVNSCEKYNSDIATCGYKEFYSSGEFLEVNKSNECKVVEENEIIFEFLTTNNVGWNVWAKIYTRKLIGSTRFVLDKKIAEDMFFLYELIKKAKILVNCEGTSYCYIKQRNSAMSSNNCDKFFDAIDLINRVYMDNSLDYSFFNAMQFFYIKNCLWFLRFIIIKDNDKKYTNQIDYVRKDFLSKIKRKKLFCTFYMRLELIILEFGFPIFRVCSKWYGIHMRKNCSWN